MKIENLPEVAFKDKQTNKYGVEITRIKHLTENKQAKNHNPYKPHQLKFNLIIIIQDGPEGKHNIDLKDYRFKKNTALLIAKEQIHHFIDLPKQNDGLVFLFKEEAFIEISASLPLLTDHFYNYHIYNPTINLTDDIVRELENITNLLEKENLKNDRPFRKEVVYTYLKIIFLKLIEQRIRQGKQTNLNDPKLTQFIKFQNAVKHHLQRKKKVKDYADLLHTTTQKLNELSYQFVNVSAKNYIINTLILESKRYLVGTELTTKEISYKLGFDEPTNFTKFFKQHSQMLPSDFRQRF